MFDDNKYVNQLTNNNGTDKPKPALSLSFNDLTDAQVKEIKAALGLVKDEAYVKKVSDALDSGAITPKNYHSSIDKINQKVSNDKADVLINAIEVNDAKAGKK